MRPDHARAIALVKDDGFSFAEAGSATGLTRNAVAGACHRAGVKVGLSPRRRKLMGTLSSERARSYWVDRDPAVKAHIMNQLRAGRRRWWAALGARQRASYIQAMHAKLAEARAARTTAYDRR